MTKEETVKNLLTELIDMIDNGSKRDLDRADEIGASIIKLFKQEPCEDAISRQTVKEKMIKYGFHAPDMTVTEFVEDCISRTDVKKYLSAPDANGDRVIYESDLDLLPSVTSQPKTGHWISCGDVYMCSECDSVGVDYDNYCPNCGARMESE